MRGVEDMRSEEQNNKIETAKQDEVFYRTNRYTIEAIPTIVFIIVFALMTYGLNTALVDAGLDKFYSLALAVTITACIDVPIAKVLKTYAASEARGSVTERQVDRDIKKSLIAREYDDRESNKWVSQIAAQEEKYDQHHR